MDIKELALQAREYADELLGSGLSDTVWQDRYHEKFAALVVQKCVEIVESYKYKMDATNENIVVAIKKEFNHGD